MNSSFALENQFRFMEMKVPHGRVYYYFIGHQLEKLHRRKYFNNSLAWLDLITMLFTRYIIPLFIFAWQIYNEKIGTRECLARRDFISTHNEFSIIPNGSINWINAVENVLSFRYRKYIIKIQLSSICKYKLSLSHGSSIFFHKNWSMLESSRGYQTPQLKV